MLTTVLLYIAMAFLPIPAFLVMIFYVIVCIKYVNSTYAYDDSNGISMKEHMLTLDLRVELVQLRGRQVLWFWTSRFIFWILSIAYCVFALVTLFILYHLPESKITKTKTEEVQEEGSVITVIKKYKIFFFLLLGFCFMFSGATAISTYLINIVKSLGGNTSLYGDSYVCYGL